MTTRSSAVFLVLLVCLACASIPPLAAKEDQESLSASTKAKLQKRLELVDRTARSSPSEITLLQRANIYLDLRDYQKALDDVSAALALVPKSDCAFALRGQIHLEQKKYKEAVEDLTEAINIDPNYAFAYRDRADAYEKLKQDPLALADRNRAAALGLGPKPAEPDFGPYMVDLQRRIKKHWFPPKGNEHQRIVVTFNIFDDGRLSNLSLESPSGVRIADSAALRAVEDAAPFRPLPQTRSKMVDIHFTFDYNVFSGSSGIFRQLPVGGGNRVSNPGGGAATIRTARTVPPNSATALSPLDINKLLANEEQKYGKNAPALAPTLILVGNIYRDSGRVAQAEPQYKRALEILGKSSTPDRFESGLANGELAILLSARGSTSEAEPFFKQSLADIKESGKENTDTRRIKEAYAKSLYKLSRFDEANKIYAELKSAQSGKKQ
jgi:TonB family protein